MTTSSRRSVTVVGLGSDGCLGLTARAVAAVSHAAVLVGAERHQAFFPQHKGERVILGKGVRQQLQQLVERSGEENLCILASGDPLFFGVGTLAVRLFGAADVEVLPQPSSIQWAFARLGLSWSDASLLSVHGRGLLGLAAKLRQSHKAALLTDNTACTPQRVAQHLVAYGQTEWTAHVCENLGGPGERIRAYPLPELAAEPETTGPNVMVLQRAQERLEPTLPYLLEDTFARRMPKSGLITKREVRMLSLANLGLRPRSVLWDVGAGSGSVAIEAALVAYGGVVYAVETHEQSCQHCEDNARALGADNMVVVRGMAPEALQELPSPDAVFVGGSKGNMEAIITRAFHCLRPGGRIVVNAVTLQSVHRAFAALQACTGAAPEVSLVQISRGVGVAQLVRYDALNPVHILALTKPWEGRS